MVYFMMISENLVNSYDGIWNTSYLVAGARETSLGRGLLHYFDKLRAGVVSMPLNSILTLLIVSVGVVLILEIFAVQNKVLYMLVSFLLVANPVICITLSYCFTSVGYGLAFLFSVLSSYCIYKKKGIVGIVLSAGFIALSLGCYQAYFGVTCLLFLMQVIKMLLNCDAAKKIIAAIISCMLSIGIGGMLYYIMSNVLLMKYGTTLASYGGASEVSIGKIIISLPVSIEQCYRDFYEFFIKDKMQITISEKPNILLAAIGAIIILSVCQSFLNVWFQNKIYGICYLAGICLVPVACNAINLLTGGYGMGMSMSMVVSVALVLIVVMQGGKKSPLLLKQVSYLVAFILLWVNILTVANDQLALKEGKTAAIELTEAVVERLIVEGCIESNNAVAFVGKPCENGLFAKRAAWNRANWYAKFGDWWTGAANNGKSWAGVLVECCGIKLNICPAEKYEELYQRGEFSDMPEFPARESVKIIDGIVVVKISEAY